VIDSKEILSLQDIQSELEGWIYKLNVLGNKTDLEFNGYKDGFEPLSKEELEGLDELDEDTFYKRQMEHQPKASINFRTEFKERPSWKADNQPVKKIEVHFNFPIDIDKETYIKLTKLGWEINGQNFKLKFKQDEIFTEKSRISEITFNTIETLHHYKWMIELVNVYNFD